jgi:hypothetical protein
LDVHSVAEIKLLVPNAARQLPQKSLDLCIGTATSGRGRDGGNYTFSVMSISILTSMTANWADWDKLKSDEWSREVVRRKCKVRTSCRPCDARNGSGISCGIIRRGLLPQLQFSQSFALLCISVFCGNVKIFSLFG